MTTPTIGEVETSAGFTAGPWRAEFKRSQMWHVYGADGASICYLTDAAYPKTIARRAADAALIAAAPELYEALKAICSEFAQQHPLIQVGRDALAKASPAPVEANAEAEGR